MSISPPPTDDHHESLTTNQLIAIRIKEERMRHNLSQQVIADHLGMDISNYSRLENGKVEITIAKLEAIAEFFKIPITVLIPHRSDNITIYNGSYGNHSTLIHNYSDQNVQNSLKTVIDLLKKHLKK
ncbi:MAG: helix-turn-helix transcriptional regulator [Lewinellaceae bacterium]|nr:helix-turn-helix transcriptional regulator [Lewinellaceae bacterium]